MGRVIDDVVTPLGPARAYVDAPREPSAVLLLGHGAGGGVEAPDLVALTALAARGTAVVRFEQPWRTANRRVAPAPARLDEGWGPAVAYAEARWPGLPLLVGGRSAGARVACRWSAAHPVAGVVALSFPLHPPGRPERSRAGELAAAGPRVLVLQGERDPFGTPADVAAAVPGVRVVPVPGCAHELRPAGRSGATPQDVAALLVTETAALVGRE